VQRLRAEAVRRRGFTHRYLSINTGRNLIIPDRDAEDGSRTQTAPGVWKRGMKLPPAAV
jgi:hypothetical protein